MFSGIEIHGCFRKTHKPNIAAPLDPVAFADEVVQIYLDNAGDLTLTSAYMVIPFLGSLHAGCDCANELPRGPDVRVDPNARFCPNADDPPEEDDEA
nr:hypothetical protein [Tanacetum cinerariifolium]